MFWLLVVWCLVDLVDFEYVGVIWIVYWFVVGDGVCVVWY